jgi:acyl-homoserine lactone acylase PvdQ
VYLTGRYSVHLCGGTFDVAGMCYVGGLPAIQFGRSQHVGWGITNNICSQRDLYREEFDASRGDGGSFLFEGEWQPATQVLEQIQGTFTHTPHHTTPHHTTPFR